MIDISLEIVVLILSFLSYTYLVNLIFMDQLRRGVILLWYNHSNLHAKLLLIMADIEFNWDLEVREQDG